MRRWLTLVLAFTLSLVALVPAATAIADDAFSVTAKLTFLGNLGPNGEARYRYEYTLNNVAVTPELGAFQVFFNSDPVTQAPTGDKATFVASGSPVGWEMVSVFEKNEFGQWSLNWDWDYASGLDVVPGTSLPGFSVVFDWNDPASTPPVQLAQARNGSAHDGVILVPLSSLSGFVTGSCGGATPAGLAGITVDLYRMDAAGVETMVASSATTATGAYAFGNLPIGSYEVVIVTPLGYLADANSKPLLVNETGVGFNVDFSLACQVIASRPRTIGYWKHQVNSYLEGKGSPQEPLDAMVGYVDLILEHFNANITNPVIIYVPPSSAVIDEMRKLDQLLTVNKNGTMLDRAKQQMIALLLNVVAGYIGQGTVISPNGATVSQAITWCNDLIQDGEPANDERAKSIADMINNGQTVPSGWVPVSTRIITYSARPDLPAATFDLAAPAPNPSRGSAVNVSFALARADQVELRVFDAAGRSVRTLARAAFDAGAHRVTWDGTGDSGARLNPGMYFIRLVTEQGTRTRAVVLQH